jgi:hypothetical protein
MCQMINGRGELTDGRIGDVVAAAFEDLFRGAVLPALARTGAQRYEPLRLFVVSSAALVCGPCLPSPPALRVVLMWAGGRRSSR